MKKALINLLLYFLKSEVGLEKGRGFEDSCSIDWFT